MSLEKIKTFPNETLIFPSEDNYLSHLMFVKAVDPKNELLNLKLKMVKKEKDQSSTSNIPTLLYEEKALNPYLRCNEKYYKDLVNESDPVRVFTKLQKMQEMLFP